MLIFGDDEVELGTKCNIPATPREIVESLLTEQSFSAKKLAEALGVTTQTIYRIRKGHCPHPKIHLNLIQLYLSLFHKASQIVGSGHNTN